MSNQSIIEHRANMYYVEFREDYLALALACTYKKPTGKSKSSPYCKALILAIAEGWTNNKRGNKDLTFYMTYEQWIESMYGMFSRSVIIDSVSELVGETLLSREIFRVGGKDTFRYLFNHVEVNTRLKSLEAREPDVTRPLVDAETGIKVDGYKSRRVTGIKVDADGYKSRRNIESTQHPSTDHKETYDADASLPHVFSPEEIRTAIAHASNMGISQGDITEGFIVEVIKLLTGKDPETDVTNQPELSTPIVDKSSTDPLATSNPIANDIPQPTESENGSHEQPPQGRAQPEKKPRAPRVQKPEKVVLTPQAQAFYGLYCSMPWIKIAPEITEKVGEQCEKLGAHLTTQEQLFKLRTFMSRKPFFKGKGFTFGLLVLALNDYASEQEPIDLQKRRDEANRNTPSQPSDAEKEAKIQECKAALARLKEQERLSQVYPGRMGA